MYQRSLCCGGKFLHKYELTEIKEEYVVEICTRCKDRQFFKQKIPNHIYLSYHIRACLQKWHPRFLKEYKNG